MNRYESWRGNPSDSISAGGNMSSGTHQNRIVKAIFTVNTRLNMRYAARRRAILRPGRKDAAQFHLMNLSYKRIGRSRTRVPVAANIALPMAGGTAISGGSPRPVGNSVLAMNLMSSSGTSLMRKGL